MSSHEPGSAPVAFNGRISRQTTHPRVQGLEVCVSGRVVRIARLRAEYYDVLDDPASFIGEFRRAGPKANIFTFLQNAADLEPRHPYHLEYDSIAVLPITTFDHWWKVQIKDKIRNMARRAAKKGVEIRVVPFDEALVRGIKAIYDESPIRQGRRFVHYGKDLATVWADHVTFLDRSEFIAAYAGDELIGFIKLVHGRGISCLMQIIARMSERDKAPIDALLAKAVELCAQKGVTRLQYGSWSRRGLGEYKVHRGFVRVEVPRYYVALDVLGSAAIRMRLHRSMLSFIPSTVLDRLTDLRSSWLTRRDK